MTEKLTSHKRLYGNMIANYIGAFWAALVQVIATPFLLHLLGADAYGLVAFHLSLLLFFFFLDQTVSLFFNRQLSSLPVDDRQGRADLFKTLEIISLVMAVILGGGVILAAPIISNHWLTDTALSPQTVANAVRWIGFSIALQWPSFFYSGGFQGLQSHGDITWIRSVIRTLQFAGAILLLKFWRSDIAVYLGWTAFVFLIQSLWMRHRLHHLLGRMRGKFDLSCLRHHASFGGGIMAIALSSVILLQFDKFYLSAFVPLSDFSAYSLCFTLCVYIFTVAILPINNTMLAHFTRLLNDDPTRTLLRAEYSKWTQINMILSVPAYTVLAVFARPLLTIWLHGSPETVDVMVGLMPLIAFGHILNVLYFLPYKLQLACGKIQPLLGVNIALIAIMIPFMIWAVPHYGLYAGAGFWVFFNVAYYLIWSPIMHTQQIPESRLSWILRDTLPAFILSLGLMGILGFVKNMPLNLWAGFALSCVMGVGMTGICLILLPKGRKSLINMITKRAEI
jgi:O-antigen/teichoic acid export membrane protein